jgi:hypothetical protein
VGLRTEFVLVGCDGLYNRERVELDRFILYCARIKMVDIHGCR